MASLDTQAKNILLLLPSKSVIWLRWSVFIFLKSLPWSCSRHVQFLDKSIAIPGINELELSWVPNDATHIGPTSHATTHTGNKMEEVRESMEPNDGDDAKPSLANGSDDADSVEEYDVADDADQWL